MRLKDLLKTNITEDISYRPSVTQNRGSVFEDGYLADPLWDTSEALLLILGLLTLVLCCLL
jgi:hypothetical protein